MKDLQYEGLRDLLEEIRDRLPVTSVATPATSLTGVITLPEEPPVGTKLQDVEDDTWEHFARGWKHGDEGPYEAWATVLLYAPLVVVSAPDQSAAKSTDAILADVRAMVNDWKESRNSIVKECAQDILDVLDGK